MQNIAEYAMSKKVSIKDAEEIAHGWSKEDSPQEIYWAYHPKNGNYIVLDNRNNAHRIVSFFTFQATTEYTAGHFDENSIRKNDRIYARRERFRSDWKFVLKSYQRLVACMIEESVGYFTPQAAANAIMAHKKNAYWGCEWYSHIDSCRNPGKLWDKDYDDRIKVINHDVISEAYKKRKYFRSQRSRAIVSENIAGNESIGASWF